MINGIWPPHDQKEQVLAFGPQSTPGPKTMIKEEIDIAELRNKQLEELKKQRYSDLKGNWFDVSLIFLIFLFSEDFDLNLLSLIFLNIKYS